MFVLQENLDAEGRPLTKEKAGRLLGTCLSFFYHKKIPEIFPIFFIEGQEDLCEYVYT
jgi:hypothetical protein